MKTPNPTCQNKTFHPSSPQTRKIAYGYILSYECAEGTKMEKWYCKLNAHGRFSPNLLMTLPKLGQN
jgi:hypothetical protein